MDNIKDPQYFRFIIPIVEILKDLGGSRKSSEVIELIVEKLGISEQELLEINKKGKPKIHSYIYRAKSFLAITGYLSSPKRGVWILTERGLNSEFTTKYLIDLHKRNKGWRTQWFRQSEKCESQ